jgi:Tol biopolymer transport system component/DNA-binding winged helix-turn-helix (wHTH) protein
MIQPSRAAAAVVRFDSFEAHLRTEELFRSGRKVRLPNQSFRVLAMLLESPGQLVTREEMRTRLWPTGKFIDHDRALNAAVNRLREALRDSADQPRFVETLPKRGYRFIAVITQPASHVEAAAPNPIGESAVAETSVANHTNEPSAGESAAVDVGTSPPLPGRKSSGFIPSRSTRPGSPRTLALAAAITLSAVLVIAATISLLAKRTNTGPTSARHLVPLASLPGQAVMPTFSPDGTEVAFAWDGGSADRHQFDLYIKPLGSERLLRLTHQPSKWIAPAWSPDGSTIAFVRQTQEGAGIFVLPALGGAERRVVAEGVAIGSFMQISWSPDGRRLAYSAYGPQSVPQVYLVALDTLKREALAPAPECVDAGEPAFSPDGKQLALTCMSSAAVYAIYLIDLPRGSMRLLANMMGTPQGLAWVPDGSRLILSNDQGDGGELWGLALNGQLTQLPFGEDGSQPALAAHGGRMAYVRAHRSVDIWRADLSAPTPEDSALKLIYSTRIQIAPRYSPDGTRIAFQSNRSGSTEIWTADAQGSDPDKLTSFNGPFTSSPSWCSDGQRIAFDSRASGASAIYVEDLRERVPRKVATSVENLSFPVWSQDCHWLFAGSANGRLYRLPAGGGPAERVTERPSWYCAVIAGRVIFNVGRPKGVELWSKPAGGGPEAPLENMPTLTYTDGWVATLAGIYYTDDRAQLVTVSFYDFASHTSRKVMSLQGIALPGQGLGIAVSPDERWLLYSQTNEERSEIEVAPAW